MNVKINRPTGFQIPRFTDEQLVAKLLEVASECKVNITMTKLKYLYSDSENDLQGELKPEKLHNLGTIAISHIYSTFDVGIIIRVNRKIDPNDQSYINGSIDKITIDPASNNPKPEQFIAILQSSRTHFKAIDTKPFPDSLDESLKFAYQSRENDLQRLEKMQENFFDAMTKYSLDQQRKQSEFQQYLEKEYSERQAKLEGQHLERLKQLEERETELIKIRSAIDERENRQARRDIYRELKGKIDKRSIESELTKGTQNRRRGTFWFTLAMMVVFGGIFFVCLVINLRSSEINWITVGSQIGSSVVFIAIGTFMIRWLNQHAQRHAEEEFRLKRFELDTDRANWLVELALEWKNITKDEIPNELLEKLSRSLFVSGEDATSDIHPAETFMGGLLGSAGKIDVEIPGKISLSRKDKPRASK